MSVTSEALARAMQRWGLLEDPVPDAARRWIDTFLRAYGGDLESVDDARSTIVALRAEACAIPALELERLRSRDALFFLDSVGQYVDHQPELRDLPLDHDLTVIGGEFGISAADALFAVRMALTGLPDGPPLELLFPLLGHDRILIRIGAVNSKLLHGRGLKPIERGPRGEPFAPIRGRAPGNPERTSDVEEPG
jgi:hypothetical protein